MLETDKKKVLGRGLASLIPDATVEGVPPSQIKKDYFLCDIEKIVPNTYQPRKIFTKDALEELVDSIKVHGVLSPLIVRHRGGNFELVAGERRWRAAQKAGLKQVPVLVKEADDGKSLELALIENIQRENLNCIEEAIAYQQLVDEFQLSQEEVALRVGKSRVTVSNTMRLLRLPAIIREDISNGSLTMGHARALLALETPEQQLEVREAIIRKKLSVRDTERRVNEVLAAGSGTEATKPEKPENVHMRALEEDLRRKYGVGVRVVGNENHGFIQFSFATAADLMQLADKLKGENVPTQV